jgi:hypothetical protein
VSWQEEIADEMNESRRAMVSGATEAMGGFLADLRPWHVFGGLTFDLRRCRHGLRPDGSPCSAEELMGTWVPRRIPLDVVKGRFEHYVRGARRALGRHIDYVVAIESHRSGWPHLHPLLSLQGGLHRGDLVTLGGLWYSENGYARLSVPRSSEDVTAYCGKYVAKDWGSGDLLFSSGLGVRALSPVPESRASQ